MLSVYAGSYSFDDSTKFNIESLKQESKKFLDEYFYNLVENNKQIDTLLDDDIIDYVYYKSRYCLYENKMNSENKFECYSDMASLLDKFRDVQREDLYSIYKYYRTCF